MNPLFHVALFAFGRVAIEISATDDKLAESVKCALGRGFSTKGRMPPRERLLVFDRSESLILSHNVLKIGLLSAPKNNAVKLYYHYIEPSITTAAATLGFTALHASSVIIKSHLILFLGKRSAGKSTNAIALMLAGGRLISDDTTYIQSDGRLCHITSVPREAHIERELCRRWQIVSDADCRQGYSATTPSKLPVSKSELIRTLNSHEMPIKNVNFVFINADPVITNTILERLPTDNGLEMLIGHVIQPAPRYRRLIYITDQERETMLSLLQSAAFWSLNRSTLDPLHDQYTRQLIDVLKPLFL